MDSPRSEAAAVEVLKKKEVTPVTRKIAIRSSFLRTLVGRSSFFFLPMTRVYILGTYWSTLKISFSMRNLIKCRIYNFIVKNIIVHLKNTSLLKF